MQGTFLCVRKKKFSVEHYWLEGTQMHTRSRLRQMHKRLKMRSCYKHLKQLAAQLCSHSTAHLFRRARALLFHIIPKNIVNCITHIVAQKSARVHQCAFFARTLLHTQASYATAAAANFVCVFHLFCGWSCTHTHTHTQPTLVGVAKMPTHIGSFKFEKLWASNTHAVLLAHSFNLKERTSNTACVLLARRARRHFQKDCSSL